MKRGLISLLAAALLACGDDDGDAERPRDGGDPTVQGDGSAAAGASARGGNGGNGGDGGDGGPSSPNDAGTDAAGSDARAPDDACAVPDADLDAAPDGSPLLLELPAVAPVGAPFIVAITSPSGRSGDAVLCLDGELVAQARLYRGRGSATLVIEQAGAHALVVRAGSELMQLNWPTANRTQRELSGTLAGDDLAWNDLADIVLTGDVRVPAGQKLVVGAGTRVLLGALAALEVEGELSVAGTADDPVLFTRAGDQPWGGIRILAGGSARIEHAWLTAGGGDSARNFGHSDSQPLLWSDNATTVFAGGGIVDNPGKALGATAAHVTVQDALISRCDTGGQLNGSEVLVERSHVLEMPDADGQLDDDDNDGLYLSGALTDEGGAPVLSVIRDSVFAVGEDDAIDHNNAELRVEHVWIEGFHHEGVAASVGHVITVVDSVVRNCEQGIEAGYGAPQVHVEHCLLTDNDVGLRVGDSYDWETTGSLTVRNTIAYGNRQLNVRNYVMMLGAPLAGAIDLACSLVDDPSYDGMNGNVAGPPEGDYALTGCASGPPVEAPECSEATLGPRTCF